MVNYGELVATPNTKLLLHLNGNSTDSSGNGNNGTRGGTEAYANGVFGQGASFNGSNSYINIGNPIQLTANKTATFINWITFSTTGVNMWINGNNKSGVLQGYGFLFTSANKLSFSKFYGVSPYVRTLECNFTPTTNIPYLIVVVLNGSNSKIYINGVSQTLTTNDDMSIGDGTTANLNYIGAKQGVSEFFNGKQDEFVIYDNVWSATEVLNYYNQARGAYAPKLT